CCGFSPQAVSATRQAKKAMRMRRPAGKLVFDIRLLQRAATHGRGVTFYFLVKREYKGKHQLADTETHFVVFQSSDFLFPTPANCISCNRRGDGTCYRKDVVLFPLAET